MKKVNRILLFRIPLSICNFRCQYCYISQRPVHFQGTIPEMRLTPEEFGKAVSAKRMNGFCYANFCADGETLLTKDIDLYVKCFCEQGHFAEVVTNLSITKEIDRFLEWDEALLNHLEFKCSFHYLWLKEHDLLERFADNVKKIWAAGASASIEITPSDELIPFIDEVKEFSIAHFGALPHLTIARDDRTKSIDYPTKLTPQEYEATWSQFDSGLWRFKRSIFGVKQSELCFAGAWSYYVDMATGNAKPCYLGETFFNFYDKVNGEYPHPSQNMVGKCPIAHCYNGHALMTLGLIPNKYLTRYGDIRDRERLDGEHWLKPELLAFFNSKLEESNSRFSQIRLVAGLKAERCRKAITNRLKKWL